MRNAEPSKIKKQNLIKYNQCWLAAVHVSKQYLNIYKCSCDGQCRHINAGE